MKLIVTGDETWVYEFNMQTSQQAGATPSACRRNRNRKNHAIVVQESVMLTVFFNNRGVMHSELLPEDETVNRKYYLIVMRRLRE
jgi:hypothetical protein